MSIAAEGLRRSQRIRNRQAPQPAPAQCQTPASKRSTENWSQRSTEKEQRKRSQIAVSQAPASKRRRGTTSRNEDEATDLVPDRRRGIISLPLSDATTWSHLQQTSCLRIRRGRAPLAQGGGGNTCYLSASLQCLLHSSVGKLLPQMDRCQCSSETCPCCLLRETAVASAIPDTIAPLTFWRPMISVLFGAQGRQDNASELMRKRIGLFF